MPRSFNQKLKILYLMKAFEEKTDREHPISVAEIIKYMDSYGISVERKAVYDDIETLRVFGMISRLCRQFSTPRCLQHLFKIGRAHV